LLSICYPRPLRGGKPDDCHQIAVQEQPNPVLELDQPGMAVDPPEDPCKGVQYHHLAGGLGLLCAAATKGTKQVAILADVETPRHPAGLHNIAADLCHAVPFLHMH